MRHGTSVVTSHVFVSFDSASVLHLKLFLSIKTQPNCLSIPFGVRNVTCLSGILCARCHARQVSASCFILSPRMFDSLSVHGPTLRRSIPILSPNDLCVLDFVNFSMAL